MIKKIVTIILSTCFVLGFDGLLKTYLYPVVTIEKELVEMQGDIVSPPKFTSGPKAGSGSLVFRIIQQPNFKFYFPHVDYFHHKTKIERNIKIGDKVSFSISKADFNDYIFKKSERKSIKRIINLQNMVPIFTFRKSSCYFLTLDLYNDLNLADNKLIPYVLILILIFYLYMLQSIWKRELYTFLETKKQVKYIQFLDRINRKWK